MTPEMKPDAGAPPQPTGAARYLPMIARLVMGLGFTVFGLNGFFHFMPEPKQQMSEGATALMTGFLKSGYMFPLVAGNQLVVGILLLINRFVPLALILIMPVLVNILAFHIFVQPGILPGAILTALEFFLAWCYRDYYRTVLSARARPNV
jgi:uncharacterized membrane protein YphA (DoxX/SURF4 family)